jgi:hypothetical protein
VEPAPDAELGVVVPQPDDVIVESSSTTSLRAPSPPPDGDDDGSVAVIHESTDPGTVSVFSCVDR